MTRRLININSRPFSGLSIERESIEVTPANGLWHLLSFAVPALAVGALTALTAKWLWRAEFRAHSWVRLSVVCCAASAIGFAASVAWIGQDGRMAGYAALLTGATLSAWWLARRSR